MASEITPSSKPFSQIVEGLQIPGMFSADSFRSALSYKPREDDVFLATYPKCGTTWASHILFLIFSHGEPITDALKFHAASPFLEMTGAEGGEKMARPGAIKLHLPYHMTPLSDKAKYIYVTRNPMDCCVSYFHHIKGIPWHAYNGTFSEFFEYFVSGETDYGDYFDHLLGWYAHRNDPNVLLMTYEEMKEDPGASILKMASFIDEKLYAEPLRNDPIKLQNVIQYSSFDHMKEAFPKSMEKIFKMPKEDILNSELSTAMKQFVTSQKTTNPMKDFVRKGIIGDWKNYFTEEQVKRLKDKYLEKTKNTDIPKLFEKYMMW